MSSFLIVNVKSVCLPSAETFCTTISTFIEFIDSGSKIDAATPGLSTTPIKVIFESFFVNETPVIILLAEIFFFFGN